MKQAGAKATNWKGEESILALCLKDESSLHELRSYGLTADHFFDPGHREIYRGMLEDMRLGMAPDTATVLDRQMENTGAGKVWASIQDLTHSLDRIGRGNPRRTNLRGHTEKVLDSARRRALVRSCGRILALAADDVATDEIVREVQQAGIRANFNAAGAVDLVTMEQIARDACDRAVSVARGDDIDTTVSLGLRDLDGKFTAKRGNYILIGARPSMGKTHFLLSIAEQVARGSGPVLFCSVEMGMTAI